MNNNNNAVDAIAEELLRLNVTIPNFGRGDGSPVTRAREHAADLLETYQQNAGRDDVLEAVLADLRAEAINAASAKAHAAVLADLEAEAVRWVLSRPATTHPDVEFASAMEAWQAAAESLGVDVAEMVEVWSGDDRTCFCYATQADADADKDGAYAVAITEVPIA